MDYLTKIPETPEDYACLMLQTTFDLIDKGIKLAVIVPEQGAKAMKLALSLLEKKLYPAIGALVDEIEDGLVAYCDVLNSVGSLVDTNDGSSKWCEILFNCRAFIEVILDENMRGLIAMMIPFASEEQKKAMTTDYAVFVNFICKMSLGAIIKAFIGAQLSKLYEKIDFTVEKLKAIQGVNYVLDEYDGILDGAYVYDVLAEYDKFAKCAFTVCDFDKDSYDARENVMKLLYLTRGGEKGYQIDTSTSFISSAFGVERTINGRVTAIQTAMEMGLSDPFASCPFIKDSIKPRVEKRKLEGGGGIASLLS